MAARKFKVGDTVRITPYGIGRGYPEGLAKVVNITGTNYTINPFTGGSYTISPADIELVLLSREDIESEIIKIEEKLGVLKGKLEWLTVTGVDVLDETEFMVWQSLRVLEKETDRVKQAKIIAKIIKGDTDASS